MNTKFSFTEMPWLFLIGEFLYLKDFLNIGFIKKNAHLNEIPSIIRLELINKIQEVFYYYETHFELPFLSKRRTLLHNLKMDFIYQNFYIFTNKVYICYFKIYNAKIALKYFLYHKNLKKIFKYYCSLVDKPYSEMLLFDALIFNKLNLIHLIL